MKKGFWSTLFQVLADDVKSSAVFYIFFVAGLILSIIWVVGGAEDGAWWGVAVSLGILLINAAGMYLSRNESGRNE